MQIISGYAGAPAPGPVDEFVASKVVPAQQMGRCPVCGGQMPMRAPLAAMQSRAVPISPRAVQAQPAALTATQQPRGGGLSSLQQQAVPFR